MESRQSIKETLEGFSAVLLATDASDKQAVKEVRDDLRQASLSVQDKGEGEGSAQASQSLELAIEALEAVLGDDLSDTTAAMDAVTNTVAATAEQIGSRDENEQTAWLREAVDELRGILGTEVEESGKTDFLPNDLEDQTARLDSKPSDAEDTDTEAIDAERSQGETATAPTDGKPQPPAVSELEPSLAEIASEVLCERKKEASSEDEDDGFWSLPADTDVELMAEFSTECFDRIAQAEASLLELETNIDDNEQIGEIFRSFHTIKGTSGFLELNAIQKLAHLAENLLDRAREGEIKIIGGYADLSLQSCDMLREMIGDLADVAPGGTLPKPDKYDQLIGNLSDPEAAGFSGVAANAAAVLEQLVVAGECESNEDLAEEPATKKQTTARSDTDTSIRVSTDRLDSLINMAGELVIAHSMVAQDTAASERADARLAKNVSHSGKIIRELQDLAMALRMVPLKGTFRKMARVVRDLGRKGGKAVRFVAEGEETEIDRNMVEAISDPLVHMVRNSMDHGIEDTQTRAEAGKDATGTVCLRAYHSAGNVVIELQDDGKGLDRESIIAKAVERGIIEHGRMLSDREAFGLIFHAGLSTAKKITNISGRGVGMDVVRSSIEALNGRVEVASQLGQGTTITLRLPLTMAISDAMLLGVGKERFLCPIPFIANTFRPEPGCVTTINGRSEVVPFQEELLPMFRLHELFGIENAQNDPYQGIVVVIEAEGGRCALMVDTILGQHQVVIKSLGPVFGQVSGVSGGAILGDGRIGLILDASGIIKLAKHEKEDYALTQDTTVDEAVETNCQL